MLSLTNIEKSWGETHVLRGLDLNVESGQHTLILGPSGAGKTTLLNVIAKLVVPDAGELQLCGINFKDIRDPARFRMDNIGVVFQEIHLIESLTVGENLEMVQLASSKGSQVTIRELLTPLGIEGLIDKRAKLLSRGERQRVALARAFANSPRLVLADEPTASLDPSNRNSTLDHLFSMCESMGSTALVVSHDPEIKSRCELAQKLLLKGGRFGLSS